MERPRNARPPCVLQGRTVPFACYTQTLLARISQQQQQRPELVLAAAGHLAVGETVILLTLSLHHY